MKTKKRERDFFRLNKQDRRDLANVLFWDVTIPDTLNHVEPNDARSFIRLRNKFWPRLVSNGDLR